MPVAPYGAYRLAGKNSGDLASGCLRLAPDGNALCILVHAQPNARKTEVEGIYNGRLKVRIAAPALDGRANKLLTDFLRQQLDLPAHRITLVRGDHSRLKQIEISHPSRELIALLSAWGNSQARS